MDVPARSQKHLVASYQSTVANNATQSLDAQPIDAFASLRGVCRSDRAVTVRILQGRKLEDGSFVWHCKDDIAVGAGTSDGAGTPWSVAVVGSWCKVQIVNASGATATVDLLCNGSMLGTSSSAVASIGTSLLSLFAESEIVPYQHLSAPSGDYHFGTVPAGEKWMLVGCSHYNPTG